MAIQSADTFMNSFALIFTASPSRICAPNDFHPSSSYPCTCRWCWAIRIDPWCTVLALELHLSADALVDGVDLEASFGKFERHENAPESADLGAVLPIGRRPAKLAKPHLAHHAEALGRPASIPQLLRSQITVHWRRRGAVARQ